MISAFPSLLGLSFLAPLLLRLVLGCVFIFFGYRNIKTSLQSKKIGGFINILLGIFLIIGLFVQVVALIISVLLIFKIIVKIQQKSFLTDGINYYLLLLVISVCLLVLGAGAFAIDLPV